MSYNSPSPARAVGTPSGSHSLAQDVDPWSIFEAYQKEVSSRLNSVFDSFSASSVPEERGESSTTRHERVSPSSSVTAKPEDHMATSTLYASDQRQVSGNEGQANAEHSRSRAIKRPPDSIIKLSSYSFTLQRIFGSIQDPAAAEKWQEKLVKIGDLCNAKLLEEIKEAKSVEGWITRLGSLEMTERRLEDIQGSLARCCTFIWPPKVSEQSAEHPSATSHPSFGKLDNVLSTINGSLTNVRDKLSILTQEIFVLCGAIKELELDNTFELNAADSNSVKGTLSSAVAEVAEGNPDKYSKCKDILRTISNAWITHYNIRAEDATRHKWEKLSTLLKKLCVVQSLALIVANVSHKLNLGVQKPEEEVSHDFLRSNKVWKPMMPNDEELWQYIAGS